MSNIQIFKNDNFGEVRVTEVDGEPIFCAKDVATALGYVDTADAISRHCKSSKKVFHPHANGIGGVNMVFITEKDVYRLIMRSNLPDAEKFQDWVCDEVLPTIRKTGQYSAKPLTQGQMLVQMAQAYEAQERMLMEQQAKQQIMEKQIHRLECATDVNYGFMAVLGYAKLHGIAVTRKLAATIGKSVSKYCRDNNIKFGSQKHPIFGNVNIYPDHALQAVFPKFFPNRSF